MQVFPSEFSGASANSASQTASSFADAFSNSNSSFDDIFSTLSAYNPDNTPGVALTMRSSKDDSSYFTSDDFQFLESKLAELGVSKQSIDEYFVQLSQFGQNPNIGDLRGTVSQMLDGSGNGDISKQDLLKLNSLLSQLGFSNEELAEVESMIKRGESLRLLKTIQNKIADQKFELNKDDLDAIIAACNLSGEALNPVTNFWNNSGFVTDGSLPMSSEMFQKLFGVSMATLERRQNELLKLSENLEEGIQAMLANKKNQSENIVSNLRGSALSDRSETMARILATLLNEEESKDAESSTSHLINKKGASKLNNKESILASLVNNKNANQINSSRDAIKENFSTDETLSKNESQDASGRLLSEHGASSGKDEAGSKARQDLFSGKQQSNTEMNEGKATLNAKVQESSALAFGLFGQGENSSTQTQKLAGAKTEIYHERMFDQIERGIIKNSADGSRQLVLRLDPPELGKLTLSLTVAQGEIKALIRTESSATTQVVSEQLAQLKQSLEEQGFKVASLEVETRTQSHAGTDNWNGTAQHNQEREMLEQSRFLRLARTRAKEGNTLARSLQHIEQSASISASGLHIIA